MSCFLGPNSNKKHLRTCLPKSTPPYPSLHGFQHERRMSFSLSHKGGYGSFLGNLKNLSKKTDVLTPKGVYIGFLMDLSDLSQNWV